jgi:hypothetical protein
MVLSSARLVRTTVGKPGPACRGSTDPEETFVKSNVSTARLPTLFVAAALCLAGTIAHAQTIERARMTDNDLSCQQIYNETVQMDAVISRVSQPVAPVAVAADTSANVGAQVAGAVAQTAIAQGAVRSGFGGFGGLGGFGGGSLLGGLLGGAAQQAATTNAQQQAMAQQQNNLQAQQGAVMAQQAQGRKEHLTTLFLSRGCKLGDMQR